MQRLDLSGLPDDPLAAAATFYVDVMPHINPPRNGEVAARSADGGVDSVPDGAARGDGQRPLHHPADGPPPRSGEDCLVLIFPPADHTHTAWRLAAVQALARDHAPARVNAVACGDAAAIAAVLAYLEAAPGVTGQLLTLDSHGAGQVLNPSA